MLVWGKTAMLGSMDQYEEPVLLQPIETKLGIKDAALGGTDGYVLYTNGTLADYKSREDEHSDFSDDENFRKVFKNNKIVNIFAGDDNRGFAIDDSGRVYGWGCNEQSQLGLPDGGNFLPLPTIIPFTSKKVVLQIACGHAHTLMLTRNGDMFSMGNNEFGQLGLGSKGPVDSPKPITSLGSIPILRIAAGGWHSFCVTLSGIVHSWGRNNFGQLGLGDYLDHSSPLKISSAFCITYVSAGDNHSAMLTDKGVLLTFGLGLSGQLGHGDFLQTEPTPKEVEEFKGSIVTQVACGQNHTVVFIPGCDKVFAFGDCINGQLGIGKGVEKVFEPMMVEINQDKSAKEKFIVEKIFAGGNQTAVSIVDPILNISQDFRQLKIHHRILHFDDEFCQRISKLLSKEKIPEDLHEKLCCIMSSQKCLNGSFAGANEMLHGFDLVKADRLIRGIYKCKHMEIEKIIVGQLCDNILPRLPKNISDIESMRVYILIPFLILPVRNKELKAEAFFMFIKKVLYIKGKWWKILTKWYETSTQAFSTLVRLCCQHIADELRKNIVVDQCAASDELKLIKKLCKLNDEHDIIECEAFYLNLMFGSNFIQGQIMQWKKGGRTTPLVFSCPFLFDEKTKYKMLQIYLERFREQKFYRTFGFHPNGLNRLVINTSRENIVSDTFRQLTDAVDLQKALYVVFEAEAGQDFGGLTREFFRLLSDKISQSDYGLFSEDEESNLLWFSASENGNNKKYSFVGTLCGLALYNDSTIGMNFPLAVFKKLLGIDADFDDFKNIFPSFGRSLQEIIDFEESESQQTTQQKFRNLTFVANDGTPLKKGGEDLLVTHKNKKEYVMLQVDYKMNKACKIQSDHFRKGFQKVCTSPVMKLLRPKELMEILTGRQNPDWKDIQKHTVVDSDSDSFKLVCDWFWEVIHDMTEEERTKFLVFLTGSDRVPSTGWNRGLEIRELFDEEGKANDDLFPEVSTCFLILELTCYSCKNMLEKKLKLALDCKDFNNA